MNRDVRYFVEKIAGLKPVKWERFVPMRIVVHLGSPVCLTTPFLHLDALLGHLMLIDSLGTDFFLLPRKLNISPFLPEGRSIPLAKVGEVYCGSCAQFEGGGLHVDTLYKRFEDRWTEKLKATKIRMGSGHFRNYMLREPYISAKTAVFYARGDLAYCKKLIEEYLFGLGNDYRVGFGAVRKVEVKEVDIDCSLVADGKAMRAIPVSMCESWGDEAYLPYKSPYWEPRNVALCVPPGASCTLRKEYAV